LLIEYERMIVMGESLEMFQCTEGVILSGFVTMAGRTSGETVKAPKGQMNSFWGTVQNLSGKRTEKEFYFLWTYTVRYFLFVCLFGGQILWIWLFFYSFGAIGRKLLFPLLI